MKLEISGIKCDNIKCDYVEKNVPFSEYSLWIDKLCPKCNSTLLTRQDLKIAMDLIFLNDLNVKQY